MISITLDTRRTAEQLALLAMPAKQRQRLIWRAASEISNASRRNITRQQTPDGRPWPGRKHGKRKMLLGLRKLIVISEKPGKDRAELRFKGGDYGAHPGVIAGTHQRGHTYQVTAGQQARKLAKPEQGAGEQAGDGPATPRKMATRAQAKALRKLGFKRPGKRAGHYRSASLGWITEHLGYAQAGLLIKKLKDEPVKTSWEITLPARAFLGATSEQRKQAFARALQGINYGWDLYKQDLRK